MLRLFAPFGKRFKLLGAIKCSQILLISLQMSLRLGCFFFLLFLVGTQAWLSGTSGNNNGQIRELISDQYENGGQVLVFIIRLNIFQFLI